MNRIGILGAGQLARMLALAAAPLGLIVRCYTQDKRAPAARVAEVVVGHAQDEDKLEAFARSVDVITFENENVDQAVVKFLSEHVRIAPSLNALVNTQDRLLEKQLFEHLNIPIGRFKAIDSPSDLEEVFSQWSAPIVLKTRRFGYDGKGQAIVRSLEEGKTAYENLHRSPLIAEEYIPFEAEASCLAVRDRQQQILFYPLTKNVHRNGILRISEAPWLQETLEQQARKALHALLEHFNYVGVLAVEFFVVGERLLANEMAPRVHNSGHWTMNGALTSQFENHMRAVAGLPLGSTEAVGQTAMFNCISHEPDLRSVLKIPGAHYHCYEKEARPQRKLAHINLWTPAAHHYQASFQQLEQLIEACDDECT